MSKYQIKLRIDETLFLEVSRFAALSNRSISLCIEGMAMHVYGRCTIEGDDAVIYEIRRLKCERLRTMPSLRKYPPAKNAHLTISASALERVRLLQSTYTPVFGSANEVFALSALYCSQFLSDEPHMAWLSSRIDEALESQSYAL